jgi:hypothetical protein
MIMSVEAPNVMIASPKNSKSSDEANLAYILSANYSGSTLLAMLLGSQPEAFTMGEMRVPSLQNPESYLCSCGEHIKKCGFWNEVSKRMAKKGITGFDIINPGLSIHDVDSRYITRVLNAMPRGLLLESARSVALSLSPAWPVHLRKVHQRNSALVEVFQEMSGARIVIDSSKLALHLKFLLKSDRLKIKVLNLVRDGRAVVVSMLGHGFSRGSREETIAAGALAWRRINEASERILNALPADRQMQIQYEELCRQPEATLRGICKFLGMDTRQIILDFRAKQQHVLGNDMRLKSGSDIRLDERWRKELSPDDLATFDEVGGEMNRKYGFQ